MNIRCISFYMTDTPCTNVNCNYGWCVISGSSWYCSCNSGYYGTYCECKYVVSAGFTIVLRCAYAQGPVRQGAHLPAKNIIFTINLI